MKCVCILSTVSHIRCSWSADTPLARHPVARGNSVFRYGFSDVDDETGHQGSVTYLLWLYARFLCVHTSTSPCLRPPPTLYFSVIALDKFRQNTVRSYLAVKLFILICIRCLCFSKGLQCFSALLWVTLIFIGIHWICRYMKVGWF
jgi:hypothetical protein